jgi:CheY-like chemotaxis protein
VRQILDRMLTSLGHKIIAAENGEQALERVQDPTVEIDLLVTDVVMPGMSGGELAHQIQINRPLVKIIFVSGYADDELVRRGAVEGAPLVKKPFTIHGVRDAINRLFATP